MNMYIQNMPVASVSAAVGAPEEVMLVEPTIVSLQPEQITVSDARFRFDPILKYNTIDACQRDQNCGVIKDCADLQAMELTKNYVLANDIDCKGRNFVPIGNWENRFTGNFDGLGHRISNLYISIDQSRVGIFGVTQGGSIKNLLLVDVDVSGRGYVGALVGYAKNPNIEKVGVVSGTVNGKPRLVGYHSDDGSTVGGLGGYVGGSEGGSLKECFSNAKVTGITREVGGLVGMNYKVVMQNSYSTGDVTGAGYRLGGLAGANFGGKIINSYSTGKVIDSATGTVGGLIGEHYEKFDSSYGEIQHSFSTSGVTSLILTGYNVVDGDIDMGGCLVGSGNHETSLGITGKASYGRDGKVVSSFCTNEKQMIAGVTRIDTIPSKTQLGWDFNNIWELCSEDGFPSLKWQDKCDYFSKLKTVLAKGVVAGQGGDDSYLVDNYDGTVIEYLSKDCQVRDGQVEYSSLVFNLAQGKVFAGTGKLLKDSCDADRLTYNQCVGGKRVIKFYNCPPAHSTCSDGKCMFVADYDVLGPANHVYAHAVGASYEDKYMYTVCSPPVPGGHIGVTGSSPKYNTCIRDPPSEPGSVECNIYRASGDTIYQYAVDCNYKASVGIYSVCPNNPIVKGPFGWRCGYPTEMYEELVGSDIPWEQQEVETN